MEITDIETRVLRRDLDERFANAQKWIDSREYCLVRVETTDGVVGWGECWGPAAGNREMIDEYVAPRLVGRRVDDVEQVHDDLVFELRSSYHSYVPASVVSGVDIALWDAYGKSVGRSVSRLLGGRRRDEVRAYATGHFFRDVDDLAELKRIVAAEARDHVDAGFTALKQKIGLARHFPWGPDEDLELVAAVREAVGDDVALMVDANHAYDLADARRVARGLDTYDVRFFEEPVRPAVDYYADLAEGVDVALAGGECWAFRHEFERVTRETGVEYLQPDVTSAGGITSARRVATLADSANVQCVPHVFGSAVALAASLQVIAATPGDPMLEFDRTPNPIREDLAADPITNDGDSVQIRDEPGLGIEVDEDVLERFAV
ncbi:mandelate racemase/muconate lactonizing enzyme family protein [Halosimplex aquaticum]|uniref:Mandelate racemase/muconate lactonizing enzyme family protein n=1 Tax=Halosimplex aquaticum TaxID=3026162 RepID=A0ABD5Y2X8_9EURY|nr:mandelate racemase/muconate lactonizing enzyme family protein [Halosimplex aquaticum]